MKYVLLLIILCFSLLGCFHDDVQPVDAQIEYPPLAAQTNFDELQLEAVSGVADIAAAESILKDVLIRLMNVTEIANQMADEVAVGSPPNPLYKIGAREFKILDARFDLCSNVEGENTKTESLIQNDADNSGGPSKGDEWFYIWEGCENAANNSTVTGVMAFTGMPDPLDEIDSSLEVTNFSNYQYSFDMQIDSLNGNSTFFQSTKILFSREVENDNEKTTLEILPDSLMGVISNENLFVFKITSAIFISDEDLETVDVSFDARYFNTDDMTSGYVDVSTSVNLLFDYEYNATLASQLSLPRLKSGSLDMVGENESVAKLTVDSDVTKLKITLGSDSKSVDQVDFFENGSFALVDLTGVTN